MEKAVDNVENLGFSTAISGFCFWKRELHKAVHIGCTWGWRLRYVPGAPKKISMEMRPKSWIPGKIAQKSLGTFRGTGKIFVKKHQIRHRMISPPKEILSLKEITGGRLCPEK